MKKARKYAYVVVILFMALISSCKGQIGQITISETNPTSQTFQVESCEDIQNGTKCVYMDESTIWYFPDGIHNLDELYGNDISGIQVKWCNKDKTGQWPCIIQNPNNGDMTVTVR